MTILSRSCLTKRRPSVKEPFVAIQDTQMNPGEWIFSGPHFYVANPFNKTPNEGCSSHGDYTPIDLTAISDSYLPRTNYVPSCSPDEYRRRVPHWKGTPVTTFYRLISRAMVSPTGERTLVSAIMPPQAGHLDAGLSITFEKIQNVAVGGWLFSSLPYDFIVKSSGKNHFRRDLADVLPWPVVDRYLEYALPRILQLNCLTQHYASCGNRSLAHPGTLRSAF